MKIKSQQPGTLVVGLGLLLTALGGCQTYMPETSLTLPSPFYLQHPPQYIAPSPPFPLPGELAHLEDAAAQPGPTAPRPMAPPPGVPAPGPMGP